MHHEVLIIERDGVLPVTGITGLLADANAYTCQRATWASLAQEQSLDAQVQLIIAIAPFRDPST